MVTETTQWAPNTELLQTADNTEAACAQDSYQPSCSDESSFSWLKHKRNLRKGKTEEKKLRNMAHPTGEGAIVKR